MTWEVVPLDSLTAPEPNSIVGGPFGSDLTQKDYVDWGVPVIRGGNLSQDSYFHDDDFVYVSEEKSDKLKQNCAYPGDLIFTQRGTLGQVGLIPYESKFQRYVISQSQMKVKVDSTRVNAKFLYYYFRNPTAVQLIKNLAITSGVPHINLGILKNIPVNLPPYAIQTKISDVLSSYDNLIENNRRRIELLEQTARLLYKEWFVHFRFPGHEHVKIVDGIPEGWAIRKLVNIAHTNGLTMPANYDGEIEYVDISSVTTGAINETTKYDFKDAPSRARRMVRHKDIIWSCVRPNRKSYSLVMYPADNLVVSTGFVVISPFRFSSYVYHAVTTEEFVKYLTNNARGAAYPAVTATDFEKAEILWPDDRVLLEFSNVTDVIMEQVHTLRKISNRLAQARDLLLPRLMNGEIAI